MNFGCDAFISNPLIVRGRGSVILGVGYMDSKQLCHVRALDDFHVELRRLDNDSYKEQDGEADLSRQECQPFPADSYVCLRLISDSSRFAFFIPVSHAKFTTN